MTAKDIEGDFNIIGTNQNGDSNTYKGVLSLKTDENNRLIAKWLIHNEQKQTGFGFFHDNILVINFKYLGVDNTIFKGTVVYKCLSKDLLDGFWFEEFGDPKYMGTERCFRIDNSETIH